MCQLKTIYLDEEKDYIERFCQEYKNDIVTPDGFTITCKNHKETAKHICGGKNKIFKMARACRILWPIYIFKKSEERIIRFDNKTKNIIFYYQKGKRTHYIVICRKLVSQKLQLISGYVINGKQAEKIRNTSKRYSPYKNKKSC